MCDKQMYRDAVIRNRAQICAMCFLWQDCILRMHGREGECQRVQEREKCVVIPQYARD